MDNSVTSPLRGLFGLCAALLLSACAHKPVFIDTLSRDTFPDDASVGVIWLSRCTGSLSCNESSNAAQSGEFVPNIVGLVVQGAVMAAHEDIVAALDTINAADTIAPHYVEAGSNALKQRGYGVQSQQTPHYPGNLEKDTPGKTVNATSFRITNRSAPPASPVAYVNERSYDLTTIADTLNVNYLLVLGLLNFNAQREFFKFGMPASDVYGSSAVRLYLKDNATGVILYNAYAYHDWHVLNGEWKQPGNWENLLAAVTASLNASVKDVVSRFVTAIDATGKSTSPRQIPTAQSNF